MFRVQNMAFLPLCLDFHNTRVHISFTFAHLVEFLHIAYKIRVEMWQAGGEENKTVVKQTKTEIHTRVKYELELVVHISQSFKESHHCAKW